MKNYSFFKYYVRGSWYCHYCGKTHPRRRVKFAMRLSPSTITIDELKWGEETTKPTVCHKGAKALKDGSWRPETTSLSDTFSSIIQAFENLGKAFQQHCEPASSETVARHVYDPHNPSPDWEPKIWFRCDPLKNDSCKKTQCRLNMMFSPEVSACERTSKPECSVDGKVLWPDKEFFEGTKRTRDTTSHVCRHCLMDPAECKTYEKRPCDTTETYSDFIEQEVSNERTKSNQSQ